MKLWKINCILIALFSHFATAQTIMPVGEGFNHDVEIAYSGEDGLLYAGGSFKKVGDIPASLLAGWDGKAWHEVGGGLSGSEPFVGCITDFRGKLIVGGDFPKAGSTTAWGIAQWDGKQWTDLAKGLGRGLGDAGQVNCMKVWNDELYVAGQFSKAGNVQAYNIAKWDGKEWHPVGGGLRQTITQGTYVYALEIFNNELYAAGDFSEADGKPAFGIAKWNGSGWSAVGSGINYDYNRGWIMSLAVYKDELYAGGNFIEIGGVKVETFAKWNGTKWSVLGKSTDDYGRGTSMLIYNDELYLAGWFSTIEGKPTTSLAKWNGSVWKTFQVAPKWEFATIKSIAVHDGTLYIGGNFSKPVSVLG